MVRSIPLSTGGCTWVDDFDYDGLSLFPWQRDDLGFVVRFRLVDGLLRPTYLHRQIVGAWPEDVVTHYDGRKTNNTFRNLHLHKQS